MDQIIRTTVKPLCPACGYSGALLHEDLKDQLFGASGDWSLRRCSNESCALLWLDPCPIEEDIAKAYATYYTHEDVEKKSFIKSRAIGLMRHLFVNIIGGLCGQGKEREDIAHLYLKDMLPGRVLDIGCGDARFLNRMKRLGWTAQGIDFDAAAARNAKNLFDIDVQIGTLESLQFPEGTFDAVTMNHVIEHVFDPIALLTEIRRILKPGGRLVVVTPNAMSVGHSIYGRFWRGLEPPRHIQIFTPCALETVARSAKFEISRLFTTAVNAWIILSASSALKRLYVSSETGSTKPSRVEQIQGLKMHLVEAFRLKKSAAEGEEVVLIATKKGALHP